MEPLRLLPAAISLAAASIGLLVHSDALGAAAYLGAIMLGVALALGALAALVWKWERSSRAPATHHAHPASEAHAAGREPRALVS